MALEITDQSFQEMVLNSDKPVLVDFWADWCVPVSYRHLDVYKRQTVDVMKVDFGNPS